MCVLVSYLQCADCAQQAYRLATVPEKEADTLDCSVLVRPENIARLPVACCVPVPASVVEKR